MSLVWQKQLLLKDYRRVCGPEGKKGKYTDGVIRPHRVRGEKKLTGSGIELVTCLFVNQWIWWQGLLGNLCWEFLNGINIPVLSLSSPFFSPPPHGSQDRERRQISPSMLMVPKQLLIKSLYCLRSGQRTIWETDQLFQVSRVKCKCQPSSN